jgi:hypothetical protein
VGAKLDKAIDKDSIVLLSTDVRNAYFGENYQPSYIAINAHLICLTERDFQNQQQIEAEHPEENHWLSGISMMVMGGFVSALGVASVVMGIITLGVVSGGAAIAAGVVLTSGLGLTVVGLFSIGKGIEQSLAEAHEENTDGLGISLC